MDCSRRRLLRRGLEFHVCTINKSAHSKKSANLFNDPRIYIFIYIKCVKLATVVECGTKSTFSYNTTDCSILPVPYNSERRHQIPFFEFLAKFDLGLNPGLLGHWRNIYIYIYIYIYILAFIYIYREREGEREGEREKEREGERIPVS